MAIFDLLIESQAAIQLYILRLIDTNAYGCKMKGWGEVKRGTRDDDYGAIRAAPFLSSDGPQGIARAPQTQASRAPRATWTVGRRGQDGPLGTIVCFFALRI